MLGVSIVLNFIPNPSAGPISPDRFSYFMPLPDAWSALKTALGALVGAYFARVPFAAAAALFTAAAGLFSIRILQSIAEPVQPEAYFEILGRNSTGIGVAILCAFVGAEVDLRLVQSKAES